MTSAPPPLESGNASAADHGLAAEISDILAAGDSLIIKGWPSPILRQLLQDHLARTTSQGYNVVVLDDHARTEGESSEVGRLFLDGVLTDPSDFTLGYGLACTASRLGRLVLEREKTKWVRRLRLILVPVGEQVFGNPFDWELMGKCLVDKFRDEVPQFVVVIGERRSPESALRSILPVFPAVVREVSLRGNQPDHVWWTVWGTRSPESYDADASAHAGIEPPLAQFAGSWGVRNSHLLGHPEVASLDQGQNLQKHRQMPVGYREDRDGGWLDTDRGDGAVCAITLRDAEGNPWRSLRRAFEAGARDTLINVVSQNALLTEYQLVNSGFFSVSPLDPLSPVIVTQNRIGTVIQLLLRIERNDDFLLENLRDELSTAGLLEKPELAFRVFGQLLAEIAGEAVANELTLESRCVWTEQHGKPQFERTTYVHFKRSGVRTGMLDWLRFFSVYEESANTTSLDELRAEHVWQTYMPGQACSIAGKSYRINQIEWSHGHVYVSHDDTLAEPVYRETRQVQITEPMQEWRLIGGSGETVQFGEGRAKVSGLYEAGFRVISKGCVESPDHWQTIPRNRPHDRVVPAREYPNGRVARIAFTKGEASLLDKGAAVALAQWLNEAAQTLMPEAHRFLVAVAAVPADAVPATEPASWIVPVLAENHNPLDCSILIFEDSHSDLGIPHALLRHFNHLLELCGDYLTWLIEEHLPAARVEEPVCLENGLSPTHDFLTYGTDARDPAIDLTALHHFLANELPFTRKNLLTMKRRRVLKENAGRPLVDPADQDSAFVCDFCCQDIETGEHEVFPDGRIRCTTCGDCGVDKRDQLLPIYELARQFIEKLAPNTAPRNIDVKLASAAEIAATTGERFLPTSGYDARSVGLAVGRSHTGSLFGEGRHTLLVESGFSPEETGSTLIHEMTHAWQYNMLDFERMRDEHGKLLIEGHAMWAEREFLKQEVDHPTIPGCDPERLQRAIDRTESMISSDSDYGRGYRLLIDLSRGAPTQHPPLAWLLAEYPRPH